MTTIKKLIDGSGNQYFPQTHTKAVIDDNGYSVESKMQVVQDVVNQAQMAIGAVPNDLEPTKDSTNWVTSGGVYNAVKPIQNDLYGEIADYYGYESGVYMRQTDGALLSDSAWCITGYIPCVSGDEVTVNFMTVGKDNYACCGAYDANKNFLAAWTTNRYTNSRSFTMTGDTAYIRCSLSLANVYSCSVIINGESMWSPVEKLTSGFIEETSSLLESLDKEVNGNECYKDYVAGKYIRINGNILSDSEWAVTSDFIPCNVGDTFLAHFGTTGKSDYACCAVYNSSKQYLYSYTSNGYYLQRQETIGNESDEAYMKFSFYLANIENCYAMLNGNIVWSYTGKDGTGIAGQLDSTGKVKVVVDMGTLEVGTYCITASNKWSSTTVHSAYYKQVSGGDILSFLGNANVNGYYAFLKDLSMSSGGTPSFADGAAHRFQIPIGTETADIEVPQSANYLYVCAVNDGEYQSPQTMYEKKSVTNAVAQMADDVKEIKSDLGIGVIPSNAFSYYGEKILFTNQIYYIQYAKNSIAGQSSAIYGDYLFILKDKLTNVICYNMATQTLLYNLSTGYTKDAIWHCNQCQFGTLRYSQDDMFPVLYVTVNNNEQDRCAWVAYRIIPTLTNNEISSFTIEEVQTIYLPVMTDTNCLGNFNIAVDAERGVLWGYGRNNNSAASNYNKATFACFPIPALSSSEVTYEDTDIIDSFSDTWVMENAQGGFIKNGKLVIMQGYQSVGAINLRVIDLYAAKRQVSFVDLLGNGFTEEPEGVFFYKGNIYTSTYNTKIWKFMTF